jgi:hypothetical protein
VAFTRDAGTGEAHAYLAGEDAAAPDTGGALTPVSALRFFRDDDQPPGGEQSGGAVARIRIYEGVLSAGDVAGLDRVDQTSPAVTLNSPPALTGDATPALSGAAGSEAGDLREVTVKLYPGAAATGTPAATITVDRSGAAWSATAPALADGTYTARAEQVDGAGNTGASAAHTFTVDTTGPAVSVSSPAAGAVTRDATPTYSGAASDAPGDGSTVTVHVYRGSGVGGAPVETLAAARTGRTWSASGQTTLDDGVYTVQALQSDSAGNGNASQPVTFTVDTTPPETSMVGGPGDPTNDATPEFAFASPDGAGFVCRVYRASQPPPELASCASPVVTAPLADGAYLFEVAAIDAAGNRDGSPSKRAFRVDTVAPHTTIGVGPGSTTAADAAFVFSADEDASFSCRLDGGEWQRCGSPATYTGLAVGAHRFEVRGRDAAGNQEPAGAIHEWQVLKPGLRVPGVGAQALALARELVQLRRQLARTPLQRAAARRKLTLTGFDALTAGIVNLRLTVGRVTFGRARWDMPEAGRYNLPVTLTRRGRRIARVRREIIVVLKLTFTDRAGRSLRANTRGTMVRRPRAVRRG